MDDRDPPDHLAVCLEWLGSDLADAYAALEKLPMQPPGVRQILDGMVTLLEAVETIREPDLLRWAKWFETSGKQRSIRRTVLPGGVFVSTVFLALDHNFFGGAPLLWETMVFGGDLDGAQERHGTREEAIAGHEAMVERVREAQEPTT